MSRKCFVVQAFLWLCVAGPLVALAQEPAPPVHPLDPLIRDVCDRKVVLLGEDAAHGSGRTTEVKTEILERLVEECGFSAVLFESQIYDFFDFQASLDAGDADEDELADALGGFLSPTRQAEPLLTFLFRKAQAGKLWVHGIDPNLGGVTQTYSRDRLAGELAGGLEPGRREMCREEIYRLTGWRFDAEHPYDEEAKARLKACADDISATFDAGQQDGPAIMARSFQAFTRMTGADAFNVRDRAMYDNLSRHLRSLPDEAKVIVWCATIHAVEDVSAVSDKPLVPFGTYLHRELGDRVATLGFSALGGSFGRGDRVQELKPAADDSLEAEVFSGLDHRQDLIYVDRSHLRRLATISARAVSYAQPKVADWSRALDGLIVLRREEPMEIVREAGPRRRADRSP